MASSSSSSSSSSNHRQKQHVGRKSMETEEIVRYMSNLPSYLERGKPVQDRALTFGVLDWGRLEQWQYHQHKPSVVTNNSSNKSSLRSHLNISIEDISSKDASISHSGDRKTTNRSRTKSKSSIKNDPEPKLSDDMGSYQTASSSSSSKGKMKIQDELVNKNGDFQDSSLSKMKSKNEVDSKTKTSITPQITTPEEKDLNISSKNSDFKTGSKNRFGSKLAATKSGTKTSESTQVSTIPPEDSKIKSKVKMDLGGCKEVKVDNSCTNKMNDSSSSSSSSRKRALFQIAVKNGRPLFTFSIDNNNNNILAATVMSLTAKENSNSWMYTFFTIQEVKKKKNSWLYLYNNSKDNKSNTYLPNVTAQMRVSNSNPSVSNDSVREFVLSSVDSGVDLDEVENEKAGIVVRFLRKASEDEDVRDCFGMTIVLPGGHHSAPRKGEPSPLIERWRSGGRCDCGGWDVGCRLRTLGNNVKSGTRLNSHESFELFLQGDVINEGPFFSLSPIKEGIFSVDYNASLSLLQAFSICISVIECRKSSHYTELRTYVAKRVDDDDDDDDDVAHVTYASLPPVSPVGRV